MTEPDCNMKNLYPKKMPLRELNGAQLDDVFLDCLPATAFAACP